MHMPLTRGSLACAAFFSFVLRAIGFWPFQRCASLDAIESDPPKTRVVTRVAAMRPVPSLMF
jgi:hypothetical protein